MGTSPNDKTTNSGDSSMNDETEFLVRDVESMHRSVKVQASRFKILRRGVAVGLSLALGAIAVKGAMERRWLLHAENDFEQKDECVAEEEDCSDGKMCCNGRTCSRKPRPCVECSDRFIYVCTGDVPDPPQATGNGLGDDNFLVGHGLFAGNSICAVPAGRWEADHGYFCAELSGDGGFRVKAYVSDDDHDPILTLLDSWDLDKKKGGSFVSLKYGYLGLYSEQWDEIWTLGKDEAEASKKKAVKMQMRRDGNLMMMTEDVDANNLDMDDSKIVWQLFQSQQRQQPDCVGDANKQVPCAHESACEYLCYPSADSINVGTKHAKSLSKDCKDWHCDWEYKDDCKVRFGHNGWIKCRTK